MTHSGGPATSIADACNKHGLQVPRLSPKTLDAIKPLVPLTASIENPVDLTFSTELPLMAKILPPIIFEDPNIDALIIHGLMVTSWMSDIKDAAGDLIEDIPIKQVGEMLEGPIHELSRLPHKYNKPIICSSFVGSDIEVTTRKLHQFRIPAYDGPEKAVTAMSAMVRYRWILGWESSNQS